MAAALPHCTQAIDNALKAYGDNLPPRIICTGHSLGGALATLAAAHIAICHPEDYNAAAAGDATSQDADYAKRRLQVYTFAAPRVGDMAFSSYLTDELGLMAVQVKNVLDPTPDVAPGELSQCCHRTATTAVAQACYSVGVGVQAADAGIASMRPDQNDHENFSAHQTLFDLTVHDTV
jgi:pimeloyl-ACP methyl ester carboxylesterase